MAACRNPPSPGTLGKGPPSVARDAVIAQRRGRRGGGEKRVAGPVGFVRGFAGSGLLVVCYVDVIRLVCYVLYCLLCLCEVYVFVCFVRFRLAGSASFADHILSSPVWNPTGSGHGRGRPHSCFDYHYYDY